MARILFFLFLAFVFWLALRVAGSARKRRDGTSDSSASAPAQAQPGIEAITQCAWCGVHVPQGHAVALPDGRRYCSDAHRDAARQVEAPVGHSRS